MPQITIQEPESLTHSHDFMNAQTTLNAAIANGFDRLSTRDVFLCILEGASSGGGGGGSAQLVTYTSGTPAAPTTTSSPAIAYDPTGNLPVLGWNVNTQTWN